MRMTILLFLVVMLSAAPHGYSLDMQTAENPSHDACPPTPPQTEGPYYPPKAQIDAQLDKDSDLTQIKGEAGRPNGQLLYVTGRVQDSQCKPIEGAVVEIWQASENGRYRHPRDRDNPNALDPHFQYYGKAITDKDGRYAFKTIKPGAYSIGRGQMRPSHIHFKVVRSGFPEFITQMYFAGDPHQDTDRIFNDIPSSERNRVVVKLDQPGPDYESDARIGHFDVTLGQTRK